MPYIDSIIECLVVYFCASTEHPPITIVWKSAYLGIYTYRYTKPSALAD